MQKTALFIGRFQPFHKGHLNAIRQIFSDPRIDNLLIMIGSAENDYQPKNPFTCGERYTMISGALTEAGIAKSAYAIIPVRDIHDYALWTAHVKRIMPHFDIVYSGNPLIRYLFSLEEHVEVKPILLEETYSATDIRRLIINDQNWQDKVPQSVYDYLSAIQVEKRLKNITAPKFTEECSATPR